MLTLARESVRRVGLRTAASSTQGWELVTLVWIGVVSGLFLLEPVICFYFLYRISPEAIEGIPSDEYARSIAIMAVAIGIELLSEPMFVAAQSQLEYGYRSKLKAFAVLAKCIGTIVCAVGFGMRLEAYAYGYALHSLTLLVGYLFFFHRQFQKPSKGVCIVSSFHDFAPRISKGGLLVKSDLFLSAAVFTKQTVLKLLLSEGEKIVMVANSLSPEDQATYGIVFNLGSLFARFLFEPIEEVAYTVFGKINDMNRRKAEPSSGLSLAELLTTLCRLMCIIGLSIAAFGPNYSHLLFRILYGPHYSSSAAPVAFGWYCLYLFIIAINGITEAFVHAVGSEAWLNKFNRWLIVCSVVYLSVAVLLVRYGVRGMILANCVNMVMRIWSSLAFIKRWKDPADPKSKPTVTSITSLIPQAPVLAAFGLSFLVTHFTEQAVYAEFGSLPRAAAHVGVGALCFFTSLFAVYKTERQLVRSLVSIVQEAKKTV